MVASRQWQDQQVSKLYSMAIKSRYESIRHEVMKVLGVLERTGNEEAAWAIDEIKKHVNAHQPR